MSLTISIPGGLVQLSGSPLWVNISGGIVPIGSTGYKYLLKIISQDNKLLGAPFIDAIAPDLTGNVWFNVSGYVDQPVAAIFQYPIAGHSVAYPTQAFNIQFQAGESYLDENSDLQETWGEITDIYQILKGGTNARQTAIWEEAGTNFYEVYLEGGRFLSHRPWGDIIHPQQPLKLWYMVTQNKTAFLNINAFYTDGSNESYTSAQILLNSDSLYELNCNPMHLGMAVEEENRKIEFFDVSLSDDGPISNSHRFYYDWHHCERPFFLLFANSIGGIDDIYLGGFARDNFRVNGEILHKALSREESHYSPTLIAPEKAGQNQWIINTGFKVTSQMLYLRDLLVARQIWLLLPNLGVSTYSVVPVNIKAGNHKLVDRQKFIYSMNLTISEAHTSQYSFDNRL